MKKLNIYPVSLKQNIAPFLARSDIIDVFSNTPRSNFLTKYNNTKMNKKHLSYSTTKPHKRYIVMPLARDDIIERKYNSLFNL